MKIKKGKCDLSSCSMCQLCRPEWLPAIDANRKIHHYKKGEILFTEGEEVHGMYFIHTGLVKVHKKWGDDKELILRFAKSGAIAGHRGLGSDTIYPVSATALLPTDICFISIDFFTATLKVNQDYLYDLMMFFAAELKESEKKMRNLAHMNTKGRIANALLLLNERFGTTPEGFIDIALTRQDLSSYTGTTYETLFRIMNEMVAEDAVSLHNRGVKINDPEKLQGYCKL